MGLLIRYLLPISIVLLIVFYIMRLNRQKKALQNEIYLRDSRIYDLERENDELRRKR